VQKWLLTIILAMAMFSPVVIKPSLAYERSSSIKTASYEDFLYVKAKYREGLEIGKTVPPVSKNFILGIVALIIIFILIALYFEAPVWWISLAIFGTAFHIKLVSSLEVWANTNYFYYKFFLNSFITTLFAVQRSEAGVVTGFGSFGYWCPSLGFILIYSCIGSLVYYFLKYNDNVNIRGNSRSAQLPTNPDEPH